MNDSHVLANFQVDRLLSNNTNRKTVSILGHFSDGSPDESAIVVLEKKAFTETALQDDKYFSRIVRCDEQFVNDIYGNYEVVPDVELNSECEGRELRPSGHVAFIYEFRLYFIPAVKTTIIRPCTEDHIRKYATQEVHLVHETPELYEAVTLRHLEQGKRFSLDVNMVSPVFILVFSPTSTYFQWVYNILDHEKEVDRIVFEDPDDELGFVLLPDLKWDGVTQETLYCLAIVRKRGIKSLRELNGGHLELLENILNKGKAAIKAKYGVDGSQLRIYFHYQPTFYHLHVHFTYLKHEAPGIFCEKSHLLETVIDNIKLLPAYYAKATLPFVIKETDPMFEEFRAAGGKEKNEETIKVDEDGDHQPTAAKRLKTAEGGGGDDNGD